jgi:hypothetical protein
MPFTRRTALRAGTTGLVLLAGCSEETEPTTTSTTGTPGGPVTFTDGFEDGGDWTTDASMGSDACDEFQWMIERSDERARSGSYGLRVFTEGRYDDGTAWATTSIEIENRAYDAEASVWAWSESESFNTLRHLVARLARDRPEVEEDFPEPNTNTSENPDAPVGGLREPLHRAEGWEEYRFRWQVPAGEGPLYFSAGVSVVWESDIVHFLDDVEVRLTPR